MIMDPAKPDFSKLKLNHELKYHTNLTSLPIGRNQLSALSPDPAKTTILGVVLLQSIIHIDVCNQSLRIPVPFPIPPPL